MCASLWHGGWGEEGGGGRGGKIMSAREEGRILMEELECWTIAVSGKGALTVRGESAE